nr:hypothetical protein [Candidatus Frankia alpina]
MIGAESDGPTVVVEETVVPAADEHEVVQAGGAVVGPMPNVVRLAPTRRPVATGECATAVAGDQGAAQVGRDGALRAADVEGDAVRVEDDAADLGVAGQTA